MEARPYTFMMALGVAACGLELAGEAGSGPTLPPRDGAVDASENDGGVTDAPSAETATDANVFCNEPGLLAHWRLDEGTGMAISDCTSNARHGTLRGSGTWVPGKVGPGALGFQGTGAAGFNKPAAFNLTGAMSVTAWVKIDSFATTGRILSKSGGPNARGWELNVESNGTVWMKVAIDAQNRVEAASFVPATTWVHVAGVFEPGVSVRVYVNGAQTGITQTTLATQYNTAFDVTLGDREEGGTPWVGLLDDVRLYDRALSAAEVAALAQ